MSEPQPLPQEKARARAQAQPSGGSNLPDAPALRNLAFLATGLTVAAVVLAVPALRDQGPAATVLSTASVTPAASPVAPPAAALQAAQAPATAPAPLATATAPPTPLHSATHVASASAPPPAVQIPTVAPPPAPVTATPAQPPQALASAAPQAQPVPQSNAACLVDARLLRTPYPQGVVVGFEDRATSEARIRANEANLGGVINPSYFANLRVKVRSPNGSVQILIVPATMSVKIGDVVSVQSGYRDMGMPCGYVPPLVTGDFGPAAARPTAGAAGTTGGPG